MSGVFTTVSVRSNQGLSFNWAFETQEEALHHLSEMMQGFRKRSDNCGLTVFTITFGSGVWSMEVLE